MTAIAPMLASVGEDLPRGAGWVFEPKYDGIRVLAYAERDGVAPARFQDLQSRMHVIDRTAIASHRTETPAALMVFDLLMDGKTTIVTEPWRARRKRLAALLEHVDGDHAPTLRLSDVAENGAALLDE